jgi:hypothetical protein
VSSGDSSLPVLDVVQDGRGDVESKAENEREERGGGTGRWWGDDGRDRIQSLAEDCSPLAISPVWMD